MKILYDHQIFSSFKFSGISRYYCELMTEFREMGVDWEVSCPFSNNYFLQQISPRRYFFPESGFRGKNRILENINRIYTGRVLKKGEFDVFHSTYSKPYDKAELRGKPYVITVHDMTHEKYLDRLPSGVRETAEEKESICNADAIIVPSHATRNDLLKLYPEAADKITVIYHGVRIPEFSREKFLELQPYCLHVGTRLFYRDFPTVVRAVARLPREMKLICAGGGAFTSEELHLFAQLGVSDRILQMQLPEPELFSAYSSASALVFASEAEGFGLPVIEAQSQGCVPVLSDIPCFREIGGDAALYFPLGDECECTAQIEKVLNNTPEVQTVRNKLSASIKRFSWKQAAAETLAVYRKLIN